MLTFSKRLYKRMYMRYAAGASAFIHDYLLNVIFNSFLATLNVRFYFALVILLLIINVTEDISAILRLYFL